MPLSAAFLWVVSGTCPCERDSLVTTAVDMLGPLHEAAKHGRLDEVDELLKAGSSANEVADGTTPLLDAVFAGHSQVVH
jgi:hypothetical protein